MNKPKSAPSADLTPQDFLSTFPWGIRGDRVRIVQQETENELLEAETAAAMAVMLGADSFSEKIDRVWKLYLNSQNHDVHVCLYDETGIAWCEEARAAAARVRAGAGEYITKKNGRQSYAEHAFMGTGGYTSLWIRPDCRKQPGNNICPHYICPPQGSRRRLSVRS